MQAFKENDQLESKVRDCFDPTLELISNVRTEFFNGAYQSYGLGEVLFNLKNDPMARVVDKATFLNSYPAFHVLFTRPGTFDFYLQVFRAIWGDQVNVEFVIPSPGVLQINIEALESNLDTFLARRIVNNAYVYDTVIDHAGDTIVFQTSQGIKTQDEVDRMIQELHPSGVYVQATLTTT